MKKKREIILKSKRLVLVPMANDEIRALIDSVDNEELKTAYQEMLDGCIRNPENRLWYTPWKISVKGNIEVMIGDLCFKGPQSKGIVEIGYGMVPGYEGQGYMTEAAKTLIDWAFLQKDVYTIRAETEENNTASQRVLEKLGFVRNGAGEEGPLFFLKKPTTSFMAIYMCLGLSIGLSMGISMGNMTIGMLMGMSVGMLMGMGIDSGERKHRKEITE